MRSVYLVSAFAEPLLEDDDLCTCWYCSRASCVVSLYRLLSFSFAFCSAKLFVSCFLSAELAIGCGYSLCFSEK